MKYALISEEQIENLKGLTSVLTRLGHPYNAGLCAEILESLKPSEQEELIQFKDGKWSYVRKPWVGLTDEEINSLYPTNWFEFARLIEAKLKEKNNGSV